jgi:hypothetical protein
MARRAWTVAQPPWSLCLSQVVWCSQRPCARSCAQRRPVEASRLPTCAPRGRRVPPRTGRRERLRTSGPRVPPKLVRVYLKIDPVSLGAMFFIVRHRRVSGLTGAPTCNDLRTCIWPLTFDRPAGRGFLATATAVLLARSLRPICLCFVSHVCTWRGARPRVYGSVGHSPRPQPPTRPGLRPPCAAPTQGSAVPRAKLAPLVPPPPLAHGPGCAFLGVGRWSLRAPRQPWTPGMRATAVLSLTLRSVYARVYFRFGRSTVHVVRADPFFPAAMDTLGVMQPNLGSEQEVH